MSLLDDEPAAGSGGPLPVLSLSRRPDAGGEAAAQQQQQHQLERPQLEPPRMSLMMSFKRKSEAVISLCRDPLPGPPPVSTICARQLAQRATAKAAQQVGPYPRPA
jgi:hypothetical protein